MKSSLPKVLHPLSGKPMLFHVIDAAQALSDDIVVVLHHQADRIRSAIEAEYDGIGFHLQDAQNYPGTGGALREIRPRHLHTLILNGDMPLVTEEALNTLVGGEADINMSIIDLDDPTGYGRVITDINGNVHEIVEEKDCTPAQKGVKSTNAGVYFVQTELLERYIPMIDNDNAQSEYYLTDIIKLAVEDHKIIQPVTVPETLFKGVNSKLDLADAEAIMQHRIRHHWMAQGVTMRLPETIFIDVRATFEGESTLDNGVTILGECRIERSHIRAHSVIESATLIDSEAGPMARLRPGTTLQGSKIGNFVEIKNATLTGVKAGHLSYIGDATIDVGSNIGAGTITCNYDGKAKYRTIIGKNVFVGSDSQLVAPLTLEDNTMIAAGSTVTKDVPEGALAISRTPMRLVAGFFHKFFGKES
jgi:bifunctional UDP-N-acetylglucosamine pyrophosphorylase/glucosamine-1-phosphate N-acetyltransferase